MQTQPTPPTVALGPDAVVHLGVELDVATVAVTPAFFAHDSAGIPQLSEGRILSVFDYTATWPYWERHPTGDELLYLISGSAEFLLEADDGGTQSLTLRVGEAAIVPAGTWHRAVVHTPSRVLFVTPTPARTQNRVVHSFGGDQMPMPSGNASP